MEQNRAESEWIKKIRKGDADAFKNLFTTYCQLLINFSRRYVQDTQIAENLVQDVFLKVWLNRNNLDPNSNIKSYLFTAVKNQSLKHLRHVKIELDSEENIKSFDIHIKTPEDKLSEKELSTAVQKAIKELPESQECIFTMNRYDGLTYSEIAEIQNISIKTVETHMGRALKYLRNRLAHFLTTLLLFFQLFTYFNSFV